VDLDYQPVTAFGVVTAMLALVATSIEGTNFPWPAAIILVLDAFGQWVVCRLLPLRKE
jgi:hypothetical protein